MSTGEIAFEKLKILLDSDFETIKITGDKRTSCETLPTLPSDWSKRWPGSINTG
jgi:hypothetical protein